MKIKLFFLFVLLFTSVNALASDNCDVTSGTDDIHVSLGDIYIPPDIAIGSVIKSSDPVTTKLNCHAPHHIIAYTETSLLEPTNITISTKHGECIVMKTNYPGLGIAWMSYWVEKKYAYCGNNSYIPKSKDIIVPIPERGNATMEDQIFLVKIGSIGDGDFVYKPHFLFEERKNTYAYDKSDLSFQPNSGRLYELTLEGVHKL